MAAEPVPDGFVIRTSALTKRYGSTTALDHVDLDVPAGSVYGLVGPNGAGKTTLLGILSGLRRPTSGRVEVSVPRRKVSVLPDTPQFEPWLTAREVVDLARVLVAPELPVSTVDDALAEAGLADAARRAVRGFSRGMLQRLGLAATIVGRPDLLILDEPSAALDPAGRHDVLNLVAQLGRRTTVLFSSHILDDVQRVCDTVGVLRQGSLLFQGPMDELLIRRLAPSYVVTLRLPVAEAVNALWREPWVMNVLDGGSGELRVQVRSMEEAERRLPATLAGADARVVAIEPAVHDLESAFLDLVSPAEGSVIPPPPGAAP
jgi:ABC-2 type transport system ATP-binding protein